MTAIRTTWTLLAGLALATPALADWTQSAQSLGVDGQVNQTFTTECPPVPAPTGSVWGSGLYTSDSGICAAAVHSGHLAALSGGQVVFRVLPGAGSYPASLSHGVASMEYGAWSASFQIVAGPASPAVGIAAQAIPIAWDHSLITLGQAEEATGTLLYFICAPGGSMDAPIWGTGVYTSDSAVCPAAVHAGRITAQAGGMVRLAVTGPQNAFGASTQNGAASLPYGPWNQSFSFP